MGENTFQDTPFKKLDFMCARPSLIERERERERTRFGCILVIVDDVQTRSLGGTCYEILNINDKKY